VSLEQLRVSTSTPNHCIVAETPRVRQTPSSTLTRYRSHIPLAIGGALSQSMPYGSDFGAGTNRPSTSKIRQVVLA
jgi:hypothetical protein